MDAGPNVQIFLRVAGSFTRGMIRLLAAERLNACMCVAYASAHLTDLSVPSDPYAQDLLSNLREISDEEFAAYEHVGYVSYFVYAATLFDTFLTDTTLFLYLLHPRSIGPKTGVSLEALLASTSRHQLISDAAASKAREIGYLPFVGRIEHLRQTFGLHVALSPAVTETLNRFAGIRNVIVHDQGLCSISLGADGLQVQDREAPHSVSPADVDEARAAYRLIAFEISAAVLRQVLHAGDAPEVRAYLEMVRKHVHEDSRE